MTSSGHADRSEGPAPDLVAGINRFSLDLYRHADAEPGNRCLSPLSVALVFGLAYRGAVGPTATEIATVFHFAHDPIRHHVASAALVDALTIPPAEAPDLSWLDPEDRIDFIVATPADLRLVNSLWLQQGMVLQPSYALDAAAEQALGIRRVDYRCEPAAALAKINAAVAAETNGLINPLLSSANVTAETRATLVNTLYWKAQWEIPFEPEDTDMAPFTLLDGGVVTARLMQQRDWFQVLEREGAKAIALPFHVDGHDHGVSMVILLPDDAAALPRFEAGLDHDRLATWLKDLDAAERRDTRLTLPRIHIEWGTDLVPQLRAMGLSLPFEDAADFSGMAVLPAPDDPGMPSLKFDSVVHRTVLTVDERGCEAAAATAMVAVVGGIPTAPPPPPFEFRVDKPFLFLLRDDRTGLILFIGRHIVPEEGSKA